MSDTKTIIQILEKRIAEMDMTPRAQEFGIVLEVGDGIARVDGLKNCMSQEIVRFASGVKGLALNLEEDTVGVIILGESADVFEGMEVTSTGQIMSIPVGDALIGRVVNALGEPIDSKDPISTDETYPTERIAPGVIARKSVSQPLYTGIKAIDALIPIGRGQRELIIGDRQIGKTAVAIDTIINQKDQNVICIYVAIGQKDSKVARTVSKLKEAGAMEYTVVFNAGASEPSPLLYLAPYAGVALAEYFAERGKDVLIVYDDLSKHAVAYREMSLLLRRPPGREAYPGDVFYLHSRLLERACRLNEDHGGGSITALPIIETQAGDLSAYIPTNVISITDGQIFLDNNLYYKGIRPAVHVGSSVSRVGSAAQVRPMKKVAGGMKLDLAQFAELEAFAQFSSDLDIDTKKKIDRGARVTELLKQPQYKPMPLEDQVVSIFAASKGFFDTVSLADIKQTEEQLLQFMHAKKTSILAAISNEEWDDKISESLERAIQEFFETHPVA